MPDGRTSSWPFRLSVLAAVLLSVYANYSIAATTTYTGPWAGGTIAPGDTVVLNNGASVTGNVVANGTLQFNHSPTSLTVSSTISGTGTLSLTNSGTLNLTGTTVASNTVILDLTTTASAGLLQIRSGTGALRVGNSGTGSLNISRGLVQSTSGYLGFNAGSRGRAMISSGSWTMSNLFVLGSSGTGILDMSGGSITSASATLGFGSTGTGTATVSGGSLATSFDLTIGGSGRGLLILNGGLVSNSLGYLGASAGSVGTATVSSGTWDSRSGLYVGASGTGTLNVNGGRVISTTAYIGADAGGVGTATVSSGTWSTVATYISDLYVGYNGTGVLDVTGGVVTRTTSYIGYGFGGTGTATVSSGTWLNDGITIGVSGTGMLRVSGGYVSTAGNCSIGRNSGSRGDATVSSGTWTTAGRTLYVGESGTGALNVTGGSVTNGVCYIGGRTGGVGVATVSSGTWANSSDLYVGRNGVGTLNVTGGSVTNGVGYVGSNSGVGTANILSGTWANSSLFVGDLGKGTLNVKGGRVTNGAGYIGSGYGEGTVTVSSGTWASSGDLTVGSVSSRGTLDITGGNVSNGNGYIGRYAGSVGAVTISSGTWVNDAFRYAGGGHLLVGGSGTGKLTVSGGSVRTDASLEVLRSGTLYVTGGRVVGGHGVIDTFGTATISSGLWAPDSLTAGGTLTIAGGTVSVRTNLWGDAGTIKLNAGGTLEIGHGVASGALFGNAGSFVNNGTLVFNRSDNFTFSGVLTGSGSVVQQGMGVLILSGSSSCAGGTEITLGSIAVPVGGEISHGAANLTVGRLVGYGGRLSITGGRVSNYSSVVDNGGIASIFSGTWTNNANLTIGVSGSGTLNMSGGLVTVGGTLSKGTFGTINLNPGGVLQIGTGSTGGVLLGGTGSLVNNGTLVFDRSNSSIHSGILSGSGTVTKQGAGTLTLSGSNSYTGGTTISDGVLALGSPDAVGTSGTINFGGGTLQYSASNTTDYSSRFSTAASQAFEIDTNGQNVTLASGLASSGGSLTKSGTGTLTLSGSNAYTGGTVVSGGTLAVGNVSALGGTSSPLTLNAGTLNTGTFSIAAGSLSGSSEGVITTASVLGTRTFTTVVPSAATTFAGAIRNNGSGVLAFVKTGSGALTLGGSSSYTGGTMLSDGSLIAGHVRAFGTGTVVVSSGTLDLASRAITNRIINNGGSVINAAIYSGTQTVAGVVTMSGTVGGTVNVAATGELKGGGVAFNGPVTLAAGAKHSPGTSPGTQTFAGGLAYSAGSTLNWELIRNSDASAGTNYDLLSVTNSGLTITSGALLNLAFSGSGSSVSWSDPFWSSNHAWTIIDASKATTSSGSFTLGTVSSDSQGRSLTSIQPSASFQVGRSGSNVVLAYMAVPQPPNLLLNVLTGTQTQTSFGYLQITGTSSLTKTGNGTILLDGINTFTGTTGIQQGVLAITSTSGIANSSLIDIAAGASFDVRNVSGGYTVGAGQTIGGSGTVLGSVVFGRGSTISPGMMSGVAGASLTGGQGYVAGLGLDSQNVAVPEPSTLGLAGVGVGVAWLLARRRK